MVVILFLNEVLNTNTIRSSLNRYVHHGHGSQSEFQRSALIYTTIGAGLTGAIIAVKNFDFVHVYEFDLTFFNFLIWNFKFFLDSKYKK